MTSCGGYFCGRGTEMVYEHEIVGLINDNELNGVLFHWPIYETADRVVVRYSINNRNWPTWHFSLNVNLLHFDWRTHAVSGHVTVWNLCTLGVYWQNVSLLTWFVWLTGNVIELIDQVVIFWSVSRLADESLVPSLVTVNNLFFSFCVFHSAAYRRVISRLIVFCNCREHWRLEHSGTNVSGCYK